ncbi:MAG: VOC family protein [Myxococcales bacterium]
MTNTTSLGIRRLEAIHYFVHDLDRSRRFYTSGLDFVETGGSGDELTARGRQRSLVFEAGLCRVICSTPLGQGEGGGASGRAHRYLRRHPAGVGSLVFEVADIQHTFSLLETRGGTPLGDVVSTDGPQGRFKTFAIATPFGDTTFRFVEREGQFPLYPGFDVRSPNSAAHNSLGNSLGFLQFDHVTTNFETLAPALLWMEHVLGFKRFWDVAFHTDEVERRENHEGSGLKSVVMWDPESGIKFANNEPRRPSFRASQIHIFHEENRGDGVQHVALAVADVVTAVRGLRQRGIEFMSTPPTYYAALPERLRTLRIGQLAESLSDLEQLEILVDGDGPGRYLLQIFLKDAARLYGNAEAGPFFYELIQRRGDSGFGAGNFRALFESIERDQVAQGKA